MIFLLLSLWAAAWQSVTLPDPMGLEGPTVALVATAPAGHRLRAACEKGGKPRVYFHPKHVYIPAGTTRVDVAHGSPEPEAARYTFYRPPTDGRFGIISGAPIFSTMIRRPGKTVLKVAGAHYAFDLDASVLAPWYATCLARGKVEPGYLGDEVAPRGGHL